MASSEPGIDHRGAAVHRDPALKLAALNVYHGRAHVVQDVSIELDGGILAIVGRNGMGKSTLCNGITGLLATSGEVCLNGQRVCGWPPHRIAAAGIGYVPQGRRLWPSLSVEEHLRLSMRTSGGAWTIERIYDTFPRLAERRRNGGAQLSGGEQQMLAIARALLLNPRLLLMDEPTEGLAPVIVERMIDLFRSLARDAGLPILLIEQNVHVALRAADRVALMTNGRLAHITDAASLEADPQLQRSLLGMSLEPIRNLTPHSDTGLEPSRLS